MEKRFEPDGLDRPGQFVESPFDPGDLFADGRRVETECGQAAFRSHVRRKDARPFTVFEEDAVGGEEGILLFKVDRYFASERVFGDQDVDKVPQGNQAVLLNVAAAETLAAMYASRHQWFPRTEQFRLGFPNLLTNGPGPLPALRRQTVDDFPGFPIEVV